MKETVAAFLARTGRPYDPPASITSKARPLAADEACPTLFRFPGPRGLLSFFAGEAARLTLAGGEVWAAEAPVPRDAPGAAHFGTLAILEPLSFAMCEATGEPAAGSWLGVDRAVDAARVAWVPPSLLAAPIPWDGIANAHDLRPWLGGAERERQEVLEQLSRYLEELVEVARVEGSARDAGRWCDRPRETRLRVLAEHGIAPRWSAGPR